MHTIKVLTAIHPIGKPRVFLRRKDKAVNIPNPTEALKQADKLSIQELTQLEVDDQIRDRLRVDPEWQAISKTIRQDLIMLKWGDGKLDNPMWKRYGAKAYPLLAYYAHSQDDCSPNTQIAIAPPKQNFYYLNQLS
jgi:hypothetical protein